MKKLTLIFILLFSTVMFSSPSFAKWTSVGTGVKGDTFYVDFDRIRKHDGYVYFWDMTDNLKPSDGDLSGSSYIQGDCKLFRHKSLSFSFYKQPMGRGPAQVLKPHKEVQGWQYPSPNSISEVILKSVCSH